MSPGTVIAVSHLLREENACSCREFVQRRVVLRPQGNKRQRLSPDGHSFPPHNRRCTHLKAGRSASEPG